MRGVIFGLSILIGLGSYFAPTVIAQTRNIKHPFTIFSINLLFGWTVVGWIAALVWAARQQPRAQPDPASYPLELDNWSFEPTEQTLTDRGDKWVFGTEKVIEARRYHEL